MRPEQMDLEQLRRAYHKAMCQRVLGYRAGILNIADPDRVISTNHLERPTTPQSVH